ncbi:MAG: HAMP domain-containing sensor histidine kinase [Chloroflexi bacterium]|nr:HAMP domain-containing sensor histidine kinase [Chloroflexota bacterium]
MGLRGRLIISFILIIVICLGIIAASLSFLVGEALDRLATARLADMALPVFIQTRALLRSQANLDQVWSNLDEQAEAAGICIFLVDSDGTVIRQTSNGENGCALPQSIFPRKTAAGVRTFRGTFIRQDGKSYIYIAFPMAGILKIRDPGGIDWLVLSASRAGAVSILSEMIRPFLLAGLVALVLSIVIAIILARSVYKPIGRVKQAAVQMAQGKYDQEVPVEGPGEVKELASSFNDMARQVKGTQQTLRDFVADVSHELRTPLTSIKGFAQAIQDGTAQTKEAQVRAAGIIEEEAKRMIRLVNNLLELSRLESGQVEVKKEQLDIGEVVQQCQEIFALRAEEKKLFLVTEMDALPSVPGDIDRLEQVFNNLLDNAIKHTPQGGSITIRGCQVSKELIEISVIDTGPGISREQMSHLFERFYRAEGAAERTGTGLGLTIARQIILAHGGDIRVSSQTGKGAEFTVKLPVMKAQKEDGNLHAGKGKS